MYKNRPRAYRSRGRDSRSHEDRMCDLRCTANAVIWIRRRMSAWRGVPLAVVYRRRTDPRAPTHVLRCATKMGICKGGRGM